MKKTVLILSVLFFFAIASTALAQGFVPLAPITGLTDQTSATSVVNSGSFASFFNNLYKYCIGLAAVLAVIMIIWGGLEYSTQDIPGSKQNGKERIQQAILGLVLVLSPVLVFSIINPNILKLSVSFGRIDTSFTPTQGGTVVGTQTACSSSLIIGQSSNTSDTVCVQQLQQACRDAGGIPRLTGQTVISVQCDPPATVPAVGSTMTTDQCIQAGNGTGIPYLAGAAANNCASAPASLTTGKTCRDLAGGSGFCIW